MTHVANASTLARSFTLRNLVFLRPSPMAPKRPSPLDDPPAGFSSAEEETTSGEVEVASTEGSSSEEEEEEEEEKIDHKLKKSAPLPSASATDKKVTPKKQHPPLILQSQESSSESGSGSESESDAEAEKNVKPTASKPMEETPKRQKLPEKADMTMRSSVKSKSQSRETKRAKKGSEALLGDSAVAELETKKTGDGSLKPFQRLWSEEDEIVVLKGIRDYTAKKGFEPPSAMNDFHDFIKKYLHIDFSTAQLRDKVRRLKKKYENNARRGKKCEDPTFTKHHEQKVFKLAKKVWGDEVATPFPEQPMFNGTSRKSQKRHADGKLAPSECLKEFLGFNKNLGVEGLEESVVKRGLELMAVSTKAELDEQWKKLQVAELELFVRRTELVRDQARLLLEAYTSSNK